MGENLSDPLKMYLGDIYTVSVNLAGLPGISLPCGIDSSGLPIGVQMIGQAFSEKTLIVRHIHWNRQEAMNGRHV